MMALVGQIKQSTQLRWNRVHKFKAKINLGIDVGAYTIKTAETPEELIESFKLRHEVFNQEFRGIKGSGLDFDKFDYHFDHLIIVHRELQKIIGTYRVNCSKFSEESYTALEFELQALFNEQGPFLELGRACIHKDYRKGSIISLLWRGIAEYMNLSGANILFGCSSLKINNAREAALVHKHLMDQGLVSSKYACKPTKKFTMPDFKTWNAYFAKGLTDEQLKETEDLIPSLLKSYLKLGAVVACEPAFDEEFDCIDLLTVLRKEDLAQSLAARFQVAR
ncbi:MAG: GNAT family N-acetyltransferase [Bdellovibrionales bacterium]|nr:GNAT family N-acetyltransferase [Bdellovibrionales bacterium]